MLVLTREVGEWLRIDVPTGEGKVETVMVGVMRDGRGGKKGNGKVRIGVEAGKHVRIDRAARDGTRVWEERESGK